jgi:hypothetical protein
MGQQLGQATIIARHANIEKCRTKRTPLLAADNINIPSGLLIAKGQNLKQILQRRCLSFLKVERVSNRTMLLP